MCKTKRAVILLVICISTTEICYTTCVKCHKYIQQETIKTKMSHYRPH